MLLIPSPLLSLADVQKGCYVEERTKVMVLYMIYLLVTEHKQ